MDQETERCNLQEAYKILLSNMTDFLSDNQRFSDAIEILSQAIRIAPLYFTLRTVGEEMSIFETFN